jgi:hypothetical protein
MGQISSKKNNFMNGCIHGDVDEVKQGMKTFGKDVVFKYEQNSGGGKYMRNGFMTVCEKGFFEIVKLLIENNCQMEEKNVKNINGFMFACEHSNFLNVNILAVSTKRCI